MKFIGIDLAWTYRNETGVCVLSETGEIQFLEASLYSDSEIANIILKTGDRSLCVAVDAPLVLKNRSGARAADRQLARTRINGRAVRLFMANRNFFERTYGGVRGEVLAEVLKEAVPDAAYGFLPEAGRCTLVETFPSGVCCGLFPELYPVRYKLRAKVDFEEIKREMGCLIDRLRALERERHLISGLSEHLAEFSPVMDRKSFKRFEDKVDALLSALGMYLIYTGAAESICFGAVDDGFITIPVMK